MKFISCCLISLQRCAQLYTYLSTTVTAPYFQKPTSVYHVFHQFENNFGVLPHCNI